MSKQQDVIAAITELLDDPDYWGEVLPPPPKAEQPPPAPAPLPQPRPPKVGTIIQRSDHVTRRKMAMLMTVPPPPPSRRARKTTTAEPAAGASTSTAEQQPQLLLPAGPLPPPPIRVQNEPGVIVDVPHFCVHVSRKYKARTPQGRGVLRFSRTGQLRYHRKLN
ncbi:ubiquitin carboxyl-terminal hydrolase [Lasius niger]|uniref:Ubiquitin carboxyl-terminal hydrolase n=1 Tax=Lasius niger TaxID=67767 RepID=A0A0J7JWF4_LASNI|nr:ubiquitin carboxyl-terminal hydrolase [Lasius niger]